MTGGTVQYWLDAGQNSLNKMYRIHQTFKDNPAHLEALTEITVNFLLTVGLTSVFTKTLNQCLVRLETPADQIQPTGRGLTKG